MSLINEINVREFVPDSTVTDGNRKKKWAYGYLDRYDIINISRDGTLGSVVEVGGLKIGLPMKPRNKTEILFHDKSKKDQYWRREELPIRPRTASRSDFEGKHAKLINREWKRRDEGCWIFRDGEATYITGGHYFYLQHFRIDVGAPHYRESGRAFFYFWEACIADPRCLGLLMLKSRRIGFSYMASSEIINRGTQISEALLGIISKTNTDGKGLFQRKVVPGWKNLWEPFKPEHEKSAHKQNIVLTKPIHKTQNDPEYEGIDLNTIIDYRATVEDSYDSEKLGLYLGDEVGKFPPECPVVRHWEKVSSTLTVGSDVVGKALWGSTCNAKNKGGAGFQEMWAGSDTTERHEESGWTSTGLYRFFISSYDNYEGCFDLYGNCVREDPETPIKGQNGRMITKGSISRITARISRKKTATGRINERREYATCVADAFLEPAGQNILSIERITEQKEWNEIDNNPPGRYTLKWKDNVPGTEVIAHPDPGGQFYMAFRMPPDLANNFRDEEGTIKPMNFSLGAAGCDSFDHKVVETAHETKYSDGAFHFKTKSTIRNPKMPHNRFFIEYIYRPSLPKTFYNDLLMACAYTGMPVLIEDAKPGIINHFEEEGFGAFLLPTPAHLIPNNQRSNVARLLKPGIPATSDIVQDHGEQLATYILQNIGGIERDEADNPIVYGSFSFNRTLDDWTSFDITNRKKSDASISSGLAIMACNAVFTHLIQTVNEETVKLGVVSAR